MYAFAQKPKAAHRNSFKKSPMAVRATHGKDREADTTINVQRAFGNQVLAAAEPNIGHDFSQIPVHASSRRMIQAKLKVNAPGDIFEQEADRVADQMMHSPLPGRLVEPASRRFQSVQRNVWDSGNNETTASPVVQEVLNSPSQPLDPASREYFELHFGQGFDQVRVHVDGKAAESAQAIGAAAYTVRSHIVFGAGKSPGRNTLTAHELTHVVQQADLSSPVSGSIQRQVPTESYGEVWGETLYALLEQINCLRGLFDEMSSQTQWYLRTACADGNYLTSLAGVRYIPEDRADAFGHCWIGCQGAKTCGQDTTETLGTNYEIFREAMSYLTLGLWGHNSFEEDVYNQSYGRALARIYPDGDCSDLCYQALTSGALRFHGQNTSEDPTRARVYNCSDITLDGHLYRQGWRTIPFEHLERF